jgi:hypothetical protein
VELNWMYSSSNHIFYTHTADTRWQLLYCLHVLLLLQAKRFTWHALATGTAGLHRHQEDSSPSSSSSSHSSSSGSGGGHMKRSRLPACAPYRGLQLTQFEATNICTVVAAALLRLVTQDVPDTQLSGLAAWLQQQGAATQATPDTQLAGYAAALQQYGAETHDAPGINLPDLDEAAWMKQQGACSLVDVMKARGDAALLGKVGTIAAAPGLQGAAAGYLCWPSSVGTQDATPSSSSSTCVGCGKSSTSTANASSRPAALGMTPTPSDGSSSGGSGNNTSRGAAGPMPAELTQGIVFSGAGARLQVLAHAAAAMLRQLQQHELMQDDRKHQREVAGVFQLLLLLVQQLQGVPAEERSAFLHSPAGSEALRVLSELMSMEAAGWRFALTMILPTATQDPQGGVQQQQQPGEQQLEQPPATAAAPRVWLTGHAVVQELLVPGLLLSLTEQPGAAGGAADGSSAGGGSRRGICAAGEGASSSSSVNSSAEGSAATIHAVAPDSCATPVVANFGSGEAGQRQRSVQ